MAGEVEILARDYIFEVDANGGSAYVVIGGIDTFSLGSEKTDVERTIFTDNGIPRHWVAQRGNTLTLTGKRLQNPNSGTRDPGQQEAETLAGAVGYSSLGSFRITDPGGVVKTFLGSCKLSDIGGGNNDTTSWGIEITVSGAIT